MDKAHLGIFATELLMRQKEIDEQKERLEALEPPPTSEGPISFEQAKQLEQKKREHESTVKRIKDRIAEIEAEADKASQRITDHIPTRNAWVRTTASYDGTDYNLLVRLTENGSVEVKEE